MERNLLIRLAFGKSGYLGMTLQKLLPLNRTCLARRQGTSRIVIAFLMICRSMTTHTLFTITIFKEGEMKLFTIMVIKSKVCLRIRPRGLMAMPISFGKILLGAVVQ